MVSKLHFTCFQDLSELNEWLEKVAEAITIVQLQYENEKSEHYVYYHFKTPDRKPLSFLKPH